MSGKCFLVGAIAGGTISLVIRCLVVLFAGGESTASWFLMFPYMANLWPARKLCEIAGWTWPLGGYSGSWNSQVLVFLINAILLGFVGLIVGSILDLLSKDKETYK